MITQSLYTAVFITRYLDLFWVSPRYAMWNFVLKNFYILSSLYIILLMMRIYARTREREKAWRLGAYCLGGSLISAPLVTLIFRGPQGTRIMEVRTRLSRILRIVLTALSRYYGPSPSFSNLSVFSLSFFYFVKLQSRP